MKQRAFYMLGLLGCALLIFSLRLHTVHEAFDREIGIQGAIGNELLHGRSLYSDLWDHKPPMTFYIHAAFIRIFGFNEHYVLGMNVLFNLATLLGICWLARRLTQSAWLALAAGLFFALLSFDMALQANEPNSEALVNPFLVWGMAAWLASADKDAGQGRAALAGALFFAASFFKQQYILVPACAGLGLLLARQPWRKGPKPELKAMGTMALVVLLGWALALAAFWASHSLGDFWDAAFAYNQGYSGNLGIANTKLLPSFALGLLPYLLATLAYLIAAIAFKERRGLGMAFWLLGAYAAVLLPGKYFPHYYQLLIPPLVIGSILLLDRAFRQDCRPVALALISVALLFSCARTVDALAQPSWAWSEAKYPNAGFAESRALGLALRKALPQGQTLYYLGDNATCVLYAGARAANGVYYAKNLVEENRLRLPLVKAEAERFIDGRFDIAIFDADPAILDYRPGVDVPALLKKDFTLIPTCFSHSRIYARKASSLPASFAKDLAMESKIEMAAMHLSPACP